MGIARYWSSCHVSTLGNCSWPGMFSHICQGSKRCSSHEYYLAHSCCNNHGVLHSFHQNFQPSHTTKQKCRVSRTAREENFHGVSYQYESCVQEWPIYGSFYLH